MIIDTARGPEYGICTGGNHEIPMKDVVAPLRCVIRLATAEDERIVAKNRADEKRAYEICLQKIADHGLDMQLVSAEFAFDGSKILFFFTADERVDFRELVKNLASIFHTRIELRQIGVRPALLLRQLPGRFSARVHQNGQDPEPFPKSHQNFRHLRPSHVLPEV